MRILVVNDDGPASPASSPYIVPFVAHLTASGHHVSVVLPHQQRSWIAKAHLVGQSVTATPHTPPAYTLPTAFPSTNPTSPAPRAEWYLTTSTPATCTILGLHHLFPGTRFDLVLSGPNYGRNTTSIFALSSGTLGGALEAASAGIPAIALSFAFFQGPKKDDPLVVAEACRHAVRVVEKLGTQGEWDAAWPIMAARSPMGCANQGGVVYSVNVPLLEGVEGWETVYTEMLANRWRESCFAEVQGEEVEGPARGEREVRKAEGKGEHVEVEAEKADASPGRERCFKWAPKFADVYDSVQEAGEGSDGWAVAHQKTSVTLLRANFMQSGGPPKGTILKL